jgi:hypothetical protein
MTVELACGQEFRNRRNLRFPDVNPALYICTNYT